MKEKKIIQILQSNNSKKKKKRIKNIMIYLTNQTQSSSIHRIIVRK